MFKHFFFLFSAVIYLPINRIYYFFVRYKRRMQGELEEIKEEYIKNAESFTNEYLKKLSDNGNTLIINK